MSEALGFTRVAVQLLNEQGLHETAAAVGFAPGEMPSRELLKKLRLGWDNQGWDAKLDYMEEILRRALETKGPVLECGSGLTTLLLCQLAGRRNVETWSLEHNAQWHRRVSNALARHHVPRVHLCFAPLRDYTQFNWYDPPLAEMPARFSLVGSSESEWRKAETIRQDLRR